MISQTTALALHTAAFHQVCMNVEMPLTGIILRRATHAHTHTHTRARPHTRTRTPARTHPHAHGRPHPHTKPGQSCYVCKSKEPCHWHRDSKLSRRPRCIVAVAPRWILQDACILVRGMFTARHIPLGRPLSSSQRWGYGAARHSLPTHVFAVLYQRRLTLHLCTPMAWH